LGFSQCLDRSYGVSYRGFLLTDPHFPLVFNGNWRPILLVYEIWPCDRHTTDRLQADDWPQTADRWH